ncbi:MAG: S-layer homology domain-containing protein, partial [Actinomycetota bacterium]
MRSPRVLVACALTMATATSLAAAALPPGGTFVDDNDSVHEGYIEAVAAAGITRGCNPPANDEFCPEDAVTRAEMAAFLVRALGLTESGGSDFVDAEGVFAADIDRLATAGITRGCNPPTNDRYCPQQPVTRSHMATFLVRALGLAASGGSGFVDTGGVFAADIDRLATAGITRGCN